MPNNKYDIIVKNVKGIQELRVKKSETNLIKNRIHAIYGANGTGKSSLKDAINNDIKNNKNWDSEEPEVIINDFLKDYKHIAIFDERVVSLIRYGIESEIDIFGVKAKSLYQLLIDRNHELELLKNENKNIDFIKNTMLKIDTKEFYNYVKKLKDVRNLISKIKIDDKSEHEIYNDIINLIHNKINAIFSLEIWNSQLSIFQDENKKTSFNYKSNLWDVKKLFSEIRNNSIDNYNYSNNNISILVNNALEEIDKLIIFFKVFFFIIENFGYIKLKNELNELLRNSQIIKISKNSDNANKMNNLILFLKTNQDSIKDVWDKIHQKVIVTKTIANNLLSSYNLNYEIELSETDISNNKKSNFALKYKTNNPKKNKILSEKEIEKSVSFGELNIISICIFLASCINRKIPEKCCFIFDDPISSYDLNSVQITIGIVNNLIVENENVSKVYFLSHEKHFIKSLSPAIPIKLIKLWNIKKHKNYSELNHVEEMESDFSFFVKMANSNNLITKMISCRIIENIQLNFNKEITDIELDLNMKLYSEPTQKIISDHKATHNDKLYLKDLIRLKENSELKLNLNKQIYKEDKNKIKDLFSEEVNKDDIISIKTFLKLKNEKFLTEYIPKQVEKILEKIKENNQLNSRDIALLKVSSYRGILNFLGHANDVDNLNVDISRISEIVDIFDANKEIIINNLKAAFEMFESEKK